MSEVVPSQAVSANPYVPGFRLLRKIGTGASGEVWIARNEVDEKILAIKVVRFNGQDRGLWFKTELKALRAFAKLEERPDSLIEIDYVGEYKDGGFLFYTMPAADGIGGAGPESATYSPLSLGVRLRKEKMLSLMEATEISTRIVTALQALHSNKLLHRDVKPDNVLFRKGKAVLADIGLVTLDRTLVSYAGTPKYMEPGASPSVRMDLYAAGKVLYEMISGKDPVNDFPSPGSRQEKKDIGLYSPLNQICLRACGEMRPRYNKAGEMLQDLEKALASGADNSGPASTDAECETSGMVTQQKSAPAKHTARRERQTHAAPRKRKGTEIVITIPVPDPVVKAYNYTTEAIESATQTVVETAPVLMETVESGAEIVKDSVLYGGKRAEKAAAKTAKKMARQASKTGGQVLKSAQRKLKKIKRWLPF